MVTTAQRAMWVKLKRQEVVEFRVVTALKYFLAVLSVNHRDA